MEGIRGLERPRDLDAFWIWFLSMEDPRLSHSQSILSLFLVLLVFGWHELPSFVLSFREMVSKYWDPTSLLFLTTPGKEVFIEQEQGSTSPTFIPISIPIISLFRTSFLLNTGEQEMQCR
jgi:hypothetical protein